MKVHITTKLLIKERLLCLKPINRRDSLNHTIWGLCPSKEIEDKLCQLNIIVWIKMRNLKVMTEISSQDSMLHSSITPYWLKKFKSNRKKAVNFTLLVWSCLKTSSILLSFHFCSANTLRVEIYTAVINNQKTIDIDFNKHQQWLTTLIMMIITTFQILQRKGANSHI